MSQGTWRGDNPELSPSLANMRCMYLLFLQMDFMWHKGFPPAVVALGWGEVPFVHPVSNPVEVTPFRSGLLTLTLVARGNCLHRMDSEVGDNSALQSRSFFSSFQARLEKRAEGRAAGVLTTKSP